MTLKIFGASLENITEAEGMLSIPTNLGAKIKLYVGEFSFVKIKYISSKAFLPTSWVLFLFKITLNILVGELFITCLDYFKKLNFIEKLAQGRNVSSEKECLLFSQH